MAFARKASDRVVFMHRGLILKTGTPDEIFNRPQTPELGQIPSAIRDQPERWASPPWAALE